MLSRGMNSTQDCSIFIFREAIILEGLLSGTGVIVCAVSIILAVGLKLHRQLIYRLAIYQVFSALAYGVTSMLDVIQLPIVTFTDSVYLPLCLANAFLQTYTFLVKLFFTFIVTVHLFIFAVCYKNLKKLEGCYVTSSLVIPAVMAVVPFLTSTYGPQNYKSPWCWIQVAYNCSRSEVGMVELFTLAYGPALVSCSASLTLIGIMLTVLSCRLRRGSRKNGVVIKQMLPLMSYPLIFSVLMSATLASYMYSWYHYHNTQGDNVLLTMDQVAYGGFVWSAGLMLLIHIGIILKIKRMEYHAIPSSV